MPKRRMFIVGVVVAAVVSAVTVAVLATGRPKLACGCTAVPDLPTPARDAAARFETLVRQSSVAGAWALLTDRARARYVDEAGFQPVFDRLGKGFGEAGTGAGWLPVVIRVRYDIPSEVVVVRYTTGPPRLVWSMVVHVPLGRLGDERIDPEAPPLRVTAVRDGDGVRITLPDGDSDLTSFVVMDSEGRSTSAGRERVTGTEDRLTWSTRLRGPVLVVAIERDGTAVRVGGAAVD